MQKASGLTMDIFNRYNIVHVPTSRINATIDLDC